MYAVIETGGKQYVVEVGDTIDVELLGNTSAGEEVTFSDVLFVVDGDKREIGSPHVPYTVRGVMRDLAKGEKLHAIKYKRRKSQIRKWGHRQKYARVEITEIGRT